MKKLMALLLAMVMLLCGCAAGNEPNALKEQGEGKRTESVAVVTVTINPEFELYLDVDFCVSKVRCLNADAVTTLEAVQVNLVGNNYGAVMFAILDSATQTGFLSAGAQVKIETTLHTPMAEQDLAYMAQTMANPVEVYSENNGLNLSVEAVTPTIDQAGVEAFSKYYEKQMANQPAGNQSVTVNGNQVSGTLYDENGNAIGTFLDVYDVYGPDGHLLKAERFYDDGTYACETFEYDAEGNKTKWEYVNADGSSGVQTYYENGNIRMSVYDGPNGEHTELYYAEDGTYAWNLGPANGTLVQTVYGATKGTSTQYFDENGYLYKSVEEYEDGSTNEATYYQNGNLKSMKSIGPNGSSYSYYNEDGTNQWNLGEPNLTVELSCFDETGQEGVWTRFYDADGYLYKDLYVYPNGQTTEMIYYQSGNIKSSKTSGPNGGSYMYFNEDGTMMPNMGEPNSIIEVSVYDADGQEGICTMYFDENGYLYKDISVYPNGYKIETTYYQNGNMRSSWAQNPEGGGSYSYHAEDGTPLPRRGEPNLIVDITVYGGPDAGYGISTCYYDENGYLYREVQVYGDLTNDITYYANGNKKSVITDDEGGHFEWHMYENGADQKYIKDNAEGYYEVHYDEAGNITYQRSE